MKTNKYEKAIKTLEEILDFIDFYNNFEPFPYIAREKYTDIDYIMKTIDFLKKFNRITKK